MIQYTEMNMETAVAAKEIDVERLALILETFSQLDEIRWRVPGNYNVINYCCDDLTPDQKLLTHWLCYITDRQMPFERVWEVGGYVISQVVSAFCREESRNVHELFCSFVHRQDGAKLRLRCPDGTATETANARLARYGIKPEEGYASRYMPDDLVKMYRTLEILAKKCYGKSLARFVAASFRAEDDFRRAIRRLATALDQLTYAVKKYSGAQYEQGLDEMRKEAADFRMPSEIAGELFNRKRLWCSLRDFLKSPEFNKLFVAALEHVGVDNAKHWGRDNRQLTEALEALELPGDVWNNNKVFRDGLFAPYLSDETKPLDMPQAIRNVYDKLRQTKSDLAFYPEQLDVTFDFVPRMCSRSKMCEVCLFGGGIDTICHRNPDLLCPVALVACGYQCKCDPEKCRLKENGAKGYCKNRVGTTNE